MDIFILPIPSKQEQLLAVAANCCRCCSPSLSTRLFQVQPLASLLFYLSFFHPFLKKGLTEKIWRRMNTLNNNKPLLYLTLDPTVRAVTGADMPIERESEYHPQVILT
jgi:hypothetical protein